METTSSGGTRAGGSDRGWLAVHASGVTLTCAGVAGTSGNAEIIAVADHSSSAPITF